MAKLSKAQNEIVCLFRCKVKEARYEVSRKAEDGKLWQEYENDKQLLLVANGIYVEMYRGNGRTLAKLEELGYFKKVIHVMYRAPLYVLNLKMFGLEEQWKLEENNFMFGLEEQWNFEENNF